MKKLIFFIILSFFHYCSFALIVEHTSFDAIFNYIDENDIDTSTIVLLDIDNTLLYPPSHMGSDQWVSYQQTQNIQAGLDPHYALHAVLPLYFHLQHFMELQLVEDTIPFIIKKLQERGILVIGLTARSLSITQCTIDQLARNNIFLMCPFWPEIFENPLPLHYRYANGIIFCKGNNKGTVLQNFFRHVEYAPSKVIFVDDKEYNLHAVSRVLPDSCQYIGIRYAHLDTYVESFDPVMVQLELEEFLEHNPIGSNFA